VVAFADGMGVSQQVEHDLTGLLVDPGPDAEMADWRFARAAVSLLRNPRRRQVLATNAATRAHDRSAPHKMLEGFLDAFEAARAHRDASPPDTRSPGLATAFHGGRWLAINSIVYGLGHLRPPAVVNRHGRRQPAWNDLPDVPSTRPTSHARLG